MSARSAGRTAQRNPSCRNRHQCLHANDVPSESVAPEKIVTMYDGNDLSDGRRDRVFCFFGIISRLSDRLPYKDGQNALAQVASMKVLSFPCLQSLCSRRDIKKTMVRD